MKKLKRQCQWRQHPVVESYHVYTQKTCLDARSLQTREFPQVPSSNNFKVDLQRASGSAPALQFNLVLLYLICVVPLVPTLLEEAH